MAWNYRVIRDEDDCGAYYCIHECYYEKKGDTIPTSWSKEPVRVQSDTRNGLFWVLAVMTGAVSRPILQELDGRLFEIEPERELCDNLKKALAATKEYAEGMA